MKQTLAYILNEDQKGNSIAKKLISTWNDTKTIEDAGVYVVLIDKVKEYENT